MLGDDLGKRLFFQHVIMHNCWNFGFILTICHNVFNYISMNLWFDQDVKHEVTSGEKNITCNSFMFQVASSFALGTIQFHGEHGLHLCKYCKVLVLQRT